MDGSLPDYMVTPEMKKEQQERDFIRAGRRAQILADPHANHDPEVIELRVVTGYSAGTAQRIVLDRRRRLNRALIDQGKEPIHYNGPDANQSAAPTLDEIAAAQAVLARAGAGVTFDPVKPRVDSEKAEPSSTVTISQPKHVDDPFADGVTKSPAKKRASAR